MGASVGWDLTSRGEVRLPETVAATGSGIAGSSLGGDDVANTSDTDLDGGVTLEFDAIGGTPVLHGWAADNDVSSTVLSATVTNLQVTGSPADVIVVAILADGVTPLDMDTAAVQLSTGD